MLTSLFIFSLKASIVLGVFYLAYYVLFKRNTRFVVRRVLLLTTMVAVLTLPLMQFQTRYDVLPDVPTIQQMEALPYMEQATVDLAPDLEAEAPQTSAHYARADVLTSIRNRELKVIDFVAIAYLVGLAVTLLIFFFELGKIGLLVVKSRSKRFDKRNIIAHSLVKSPFSFARWIFIPANSDYDEDTWQLIQWHEKAHLRQAHSIDVILSTLLRCLLWFNPVAYFLHKEVKNNHELLADQSVLKRVNLAAYSEALLKVCLDTRSLGIGHGFALKSNLSRRIHAMQKHKTTFFKSLTAVLVFLLIGFGIFTQTSLYSQKAEYKKPTREDFLSGKVFVPFGWSNLPPRHQKILDKLKSIYPDRNLRWQYMKEGTPEIYNDRYFEYRKTEYFGKLTKEDKEQLLEVVLADTSRVFNYESMFSLSKEEIRKMTKKQITERNNYIVIYESLFPEEDSDRNKVFEIDEVDALPRPMGGLEAFQRAIALDVEIPEGIDRSDLPETVDFSFIVYGGNRISHLNLETELKGSRKKTAPVYKFFGTIHKSLRDKIISFYLWEKGRKGDKPVNVRMVVSIPTKYM